MKSLRRIRIEAGLTGQELAEKLKPVFPRVNKAIISYAEDPHNTGITTTPSMRQEIETQTGVKFRHAADGRTDGYRFSFWVDREAYEKFNALRESLGIATNKELFVQLIKNAAQPLVPAGQQTDYGASTATYDVP